MPKKGKKKDDKKGKEVVGPPEVNEVNENHKSYYIKQIRELESEVTAQQEYYEELDVANAENQLKLDRMKSDQHDVVLFIENKLKSKVEELQELSDRYSDLQETMAKEEELFNGQLEAIAQEHREVEEAQTIENEALKKQLNDLEEFEKNRHNLFSEIRQLEMEMFNQESEHRDARYMLDKQYRIEKDKLKLEMLEQVKLVANEYKKRSNSQLSETSKRTIREMVAINDKLQKMTEETSALVEANAGLSVKVAEQRLMIKTLEENEKKLIKKNVCNHHALLLLKDKCQSLEPEVMMAVVETKDHIEEIMAEKNRLYTELKHYRTQLQEHQEQEKVYRLQKKNLNESIKEKELLRFELKKLILKSAMVIERLIRPQETKSCGDMDGTETYLLKREKVLEVLLLLLNTANLVADLPVNDYKSYSSIFSQNLMPRSPTSSRRSNVPEKDVFPPIEDLTFRELKRLYMQNIPQYKDGYLGLVPKKNSEQITLITEALSKNRGSVSVKLFDMRRKTTKESIFLTRAIPTSPQKASDAKHWRKPCSKNSVPLKSVPSKSRPVLPRLPSKVLKIAEELITDSSLRYLSLFPKDYTRKDSEKPHDDSDAPLADSEDAEEAPVKEALSDQMWMS